MDHVYPTPPKPNPKLHDFRIRLGRFG